jgi:hypothetical protein
MVAELSVATSPNESAHISRRQHQSAPQASLVAVTICADSPGNAANARADVDGCGISLRQVQCTSSTSD